MERIKAWLPDGDAALIYTSVNRRYLTGFTSSLGYLFVTNQKAVLFVDGRYILAAKNVVNNCEVVHFSNIGEQLRNLAKSNGINKVHIEKDLTLLEFGQFKKMFSDIEVDFDSNLSEYIESLREIKTDYEIECIEKAQRIAERSFLETLNFFSAG